jgi:hypothetical protein
MYHDQLTPWPTLQASTTVTLLQVALPDLLERRQQQLSTTRRPPWGVGDCAAPKLLHAACALGLRPTGLAELWHVPPTP